MVADMERLQADIDDNNARADAMQEHANHVVQEIDAAQAQVPPTTNKVHRHHQIQFEARRRVLHDEYHLHQLAARDHDHLRAALQRHQATQQSLLQRMSSIQGDIVAREARVASLQAVLQWSEGELAQWNEVLRRKKELRYHSSIFGRCMR